MFSSATNASLFPNLSPSYHHHHLPPPPFLGGDDTDFFLHRGYDHRPDLFMTDSLFGLVLSNKSPIGNQLASEPNGQNFGPKSMQPKMKKAAEKKHRCTKILTAQGLRDRRVRLSIETARKFFDLQDMLGFEKASKTIDWLLKNSRTEIKDLLNRVKEKTSTLSATASECEVISGTGSKIKNLKISTVGQGLEVKLQKAMAAFDHPYPASRESRARARERARERTREKILRSKLKGSPISSDEQQISEENFFKFVPNFGRPVTSTANGILV